MEYELVPKTRPTNINIESPTKIVPHLTFFIPNKTPKLIDIAKRAWSEGKPAFGKKDADAPRPSFSKGLKVSG